VRGVSLPSPSQHASDWYATVACVCSLGPIAREYTRIKKWIDYFSGGVLVALVCIWLFPDKSERVLE